MLRTHADRAVARHMLILFVLASTAVMIVWVGSAFLDAAQSLGDALSNIEVK